MFVVTGGAGFIGSNIVAEIDEKQRGKVVVSDRLRGADKWRNLAKRELAEIVHPDHLLDFLEDNHSSIAAVIHMGAISSTTETDVDLIVDNNFKLSLGLWKWCATRQVRFIYASSAATYGDGSQGFDDEGDPQSLARLRPLNPYGWSKHLFDRRVAGMIADGDILPPQWAGLKFFNVYGPNEYHKGAQMSVAAHIFPQAKAGRPAKLFKSHNPDYQDGGQLRDFIWVGDCVDVVMWLVENESVSGLFNCGTGKARSFADLAAAVYGALDKETHIEYVPTPQSIREKYQYFTQAETGRLAQAGYDKPFTSLEDGVARYIQQFLNAPDKYR
ncbi:MAG: ADP-glyceromanno-heptose 6-epimerase [Rhodospirillales bacterium]